MLKIAVAVKFYKGEISPFDASALEWALSEKNAEVTVISMSPITMTPQAEYITRLGADFILVSDKALIGSDTLVTSKVLAETIKKISPDIVYCGRQSVDGDTAQVPAEISELIGYDFIPYAMEKTENTVKTRYGEREITGKTVISWEKTKTLRAASIRSKKREVKVIGIKELGLKETETFDKGIKKFMSVATMVKNFHNLTVLQVGARIKPFSSIMYNELELAEKFGVKVKIFNLAEAVNDLKEIYAERQEDLEKDLIKLKETFDCGNLSDEYLKKMLAIAYYYENLAIKNDCNIISAECWTGINLGWEANPCLAMCLLAEKGIFVTCEWDMHMTITNVLLMSASRGKCKPIQGEFTCRHPENDNAELLWHCGPFPLEYKDEKVKPYLYNTKPSFKLKDGEYTIARFQCERGKYYLLGGKFTTCEGPKTFGTYMWAQFKDLPKLERKIIEGPYIHHMTEIPGDYVDELEEFCKYNDEIKFDKAE